LTSFMVPREAQGILQIVCRDIKVFRSHQWIDAEEGRNRQARRREGR
jgi:hypothetical protein